MYCLYTGKCKILVESITVYLLKSVQNIKDSACNKDNFVPFGRPRSSTVNTLNKISNWSLFKLIISDQALKSLK